MKLKPYYPFPGPFRFGQVAQTSFALTELDGEMYAIEDRKVALTTLWFK